MIKIKNLIINDVLSVNWKYIDYRVVHGLSY